jgi:hypothetical protein
MYNLLFSHKSRIGSPESEQDTNTRKKGPYQVTEDAVKELIVPHGAFRSLTPGPSPFSINPTPAFSSAC